MPMSPGLVTARRSVPSEIQAPEYYETGMPHRAPNKIMTFSGGELTAMRKSASLARRMLDYACSLVRPGVSTEEIDRRTHEEIVRHGAYPSPINYAGFPKAICTSVNEVCCHGIPDSRELQAGDIISIDVSVYLAGYHGDNCATVVVGDNCDRRGQELIDAAKEALDGAISICRPDAQFNSIGSTIEDIATKRGFQICHEFMGHGVGSILHMSPLVAHYRNQDTTKMKPGMIFTIEPILLEGSKSIGKWPDNWSAVTHDYGRSAQFEHEVLITEKGHEILTLPP